MKTHIKLLFFAKGRKLTLTLALFLLVFAAASVMKIQAGSEHNVSGWIGGWSEDGIGNYTGVGWISMNNTNSGAGGPHSYGVNIPSTDGPITGTNNYAWSPNIGWVSFNSTDLSGCPSGTCNARRSGNKLEGWARVIGIKTELEKPVPNSGGWQGWIKLSSVSGDPFSYGVVINSDGTFADCNPSSGGVGCAWSGENIISGIPHGLGWIDFSHAKITPEVPPEPVCSISCPEYIAIPLGGSDNITCSVSGDGCVATNCTDEGTIDVITGEPIFASGSCQITIEPDAGIEETTIVRTHGTNDIYDDTTVRVKRTGWTETSP